MSCFSAKFLPIIIFKPIQIGFPKESWYVTAYIFYVKTHVGMLGILFLTKSLVKMK